MRFEERTRPPEAGDHCKDAAGCGGCTACGSAAPAVPYSGVAVVFGALGLFVLPVLLAVGGAWLAAGNAPGQLAGGLGGLLAGMALAGFGHRLLNRKTKEGSQ